MGLLVFHLPKLPSPVESLSESVFEVPAHREIRISTRLPRLIFILDGTARVQWGNQPPVPLQAGDALVLPQPTHYVYRSLSPGKTARVHALVIALKNGPSPLTTLLNARFPQAQHCAAIQNATMLHSIHLIRREAEEREHGFALAAASLASLLVLALLRNREADRNRPIRAKRSSRYLVEQAREYIVKNFAEPLTLPGIAWHLRLSEEYLARLFKRETGQTVFEFIRDFRIDSAKRLLSGTNHSVIRIAEMAGFSSSTIFCRAFRQATGLTPGRYRTAHAGNPNPSLGKAKKSIQAHRGQSQVM